jgi:hypothetical protein
MCETSCSQPNLDDVKKEAKDLFHRLQRRDPGALRRYRAIDSFADTSEPRLDDAQFIIARERGFRGWQKLKEHLETTSRAQDHC